MAHIETIDTREPLIQRMEKRTVPDFPEPRSYADADTGGLTNFFKCCFAAKGWLVTCVSMPCACCGCGPVTVVSEGHRAAVLRYGKFERIVPPGTYHVNVGVERFIVKSIQVQSANIPKQRVLTKDNVPISLDAVCFYRVIDVKKAIFNVVNCDQAVLNLAQSTLETLLGEKTLDELLTDRHNITHRVAELLDEMCLNWGVHIEALEVRDIQMPEKMSRIMAIVAETEREGQAKVVSANAELKASKTYAKAAEIMSSNPVSLQLRYFQTLQEIAAEKNSTIIVPSEITNMFRPLVKWSESDAFARNLPPEVMQMLNEQEKKKQAQVELIDGE